MLEIYKQLRILMYRIRHEAFYKWGLKYTYVSVQLKLFCNVVLERHVPIARGQPECCYDRHVIVKLLHSHISEVPVNK
jgi:hypothetical protein